MGCYQGLMYELTVHDVEPGLVQRLQRRAAKHGLSVEEEHREILRRALKLEDELPDLESLLLAFPDVGEDEDFKRLPQLPRELDLT